LDVESVSSDLKTIDDYRRFRRGFVQQWDRTLSIFCGKCLSIVLDFPANTVGNRSWMRSLIAQADAAHELHLLRS
jgi:hypothetical protein